MIAPVSSAVTPPDPKVATAAKQFEAIFVRQLLAEAHKANFDDGLFSSGAMDNFQSMQDARFADIAAEKGSFGIGAMLTRALARRP